MCQQRHLLIYLKAALPELRIYVKTQNQHGYSEEWHPDEVKKHFIFY
jgi:hypothetical protein